jgi:hypothetical protein
MILTVRFKHTLKFIEGKNTVHHGELLSFNDSNAHKIANEISIIRVGKFSAEGINRSENSHFLLASRSKDDPAGKNKKFLGYLRENSDRCAVLQLNRHGSIGFLTAATTEDRQSMGGEDGYRCFIKSEQNFGHTARDSTTDIDTGFIPTSPTLPPPAALLSANSTSRTSSKDPDAWHFEAFPPVATSSSSLGTKIYADTSELQSPPDSPPRYLEFLQNPSFAHLELGQRDPFYDSVALVNDIDDGIAVGGIHSNRGAEQAAAAEHYNRLQRDRASRHKSQIFHMRNLNNMVKERLIHLAAHSPGIADPIHGLKVLDFGCGMGGDIQKWFKNGVRLGRYVGVDLAKESLVKFAQQRIAHITRTTILSHLI